MSGQVNLKVLIKNKKLNAGIVVFLLYLSFCAAEFLSYRGAFAAVVSELNVKSVIVSNYIVAFLLCGLVPVILYEIIVRFIFRFSQARIGGGTENYLYALRFFYIGANLVIFLIKLVYLWYPIAHIYGDIAIDFLITTVAFALFLYYVLRKAPKERIAPILYQFGGSYVIVYGFLSLITLLLEVV